MKDEHVINVSGLYKSFAGKMVVNNLALDVKKGEVFGFLGPNGSGKTTTIRMLCGLLTPDRGQGSCLGFDILNDSRKIRNFVGYMTQKFSFYTDLTVEENLAFIAGIFNLDQRKHRVEKIMEEFNLIDRRRQLTGELSGGWKQRLALAACLLHEPRLLLLDEPTAGVDPMARRDFWNKIHGLSDAGVTTFVSTHYMDEAERCTRLAYLAYGELLVTGSVNEVIKATGLYTWAIEGQITLQLLQEARSLSGVTQAAFFGSEIHISGYDQHLVEQSLADFVKTRPVQWHAIRPTLEDAFISLVKQSKGELL